ncbi:tape measure protein [Pediococcus ethanolidurans]|uniref:aggregation-promoting factor C-terminal-like domain-containing protein n=1 Tax=Pediococcus ethanolidurans TaxID=319653 RepID=UPI0021E7D0CA|nr:tape measure protein [Pediococcus ethanolidurans]MCV3327670.1 tape measure protein [Pediococcus ethanolidurans]
MNNMGKTAGLNFDVFLDDHGMKRSMQELKSTAAMLKSEMHANFAELRSGGQVTDAYAGKVKDSERAIKAQNNIIADARKAQKGLNLQTEEGRTEFAKQEKIITSAKKSITSLTGEQKRAQRSLEYYKSGMADMNKAMKVASSASETYVSRLRAEGKENEANREQLTGLRNKYSSLSDIYKKQEAELDKIAKSSGKTSEAYLKQKTRLDQTGKAMAEARTDMSSLNETIKKANLTPFDRLKNKITGVNKEGKETHSIFKSVLGADLISNAVMGAWSSLSSHIHEAVKAGEEYDKEQQKMGATWNTLTFSGTKSKAMVNTINDLSVKTGQAVGAVNELEQGFYHLHSNKKESDELTKSMLNMSDAVGLDSQQIQAVTQDMVNGLSRGKANAGMLNQISQYFPMFREQLAKYETQVNHGKKVTVADLSEMAKQGKISSTDIEKVFEKLGNGKYDKAASNMLQTMVGMERTIKARVPALIGDIEQPIMNAKNPVYGVISKWISDPKTNTEFKKFGDASAKGISTVTAAFGKGMNIKSGPQVLDKVIVGLTKDVTNFSDYIAKHAKNITNFFGGVKDTTVESWKLMSQVFLDLSKVTLPLLNFMAKHPKVFAPVIAGAIAYNKALKPILAISTIGKGLFIKPQIDTVTGEKQLTTFGTWAQKQMSRIGLNNSIGIGNKWKSMNKVGKVATVAVGVKAVYDASTDIAKGMKERNKDKKLKDYGKGAGKIIGTAIGFSMAGPLGALAGGALGTKFASGFISSWEKYQKKHPLKVSQVKGGEGNQVVYEWNKGISGDIDSKQRKKEGIVNNVTDPRMLANAVGYGVGDVGYWTGKTGKGISSAWDFMNKQNKKNDKKTSQGIQSVWKWLTTNQNPGKGSKTITMPKIKFPKIKLPNIWKWLTTDVKPKTKPIKAPKFKKIKWPSLPKWMNWKTWKWPKFKAPKMHKIKWPSLPKWMNWKNWHWPKFKTPKMPRIKWPKMPNLAKPWKSETGKLSRNFDKWKKSFSKSWKKHWRSTKGTLSSSWKSMKKNTNNWGNNTKKWFSSFKKPFSKSWKKHWRSTRNYLGNRWNDMRKKSGSWGTSMEKWRKSFSSTFKKGFYSLGSGIHGIWSNMWGGLHKLAKKGMKGVVGIINDGINGIDGVIHRFGGRKYAIKPIHFATGTGSLSSNFRKSIDRVTPAVVNDEPGAKNPELIFRKATGNVEYMKGNNANTLLMPGDEVANAHDSAVLAPQLGISHFAKGGIGSFFSSLGSTISDTVSGVVSTVKKDASWLKKLFKTAVKIIKHPIKSVESLFKYSKGTTKGVFRQLSKGAFGKVESFAKSWWSKLWSMVNLNKGKSSKTSTKGIKGQVGSEFWKTISKLADKFGVNTGETPTGSHKHWMKQAGIPKSWYNAMNTIISAESGWNVHAQNPTSSAYGIPQALPGSKMASAGKDWRDNAITQLKWMKGYVKGRYGNASNALKFRKSHNWYANGGFSNVAKLANISEGNTLESIIPLSKPSRAWELIGKSAAYLDKKNNSHTTSANTSEDNSAYLQKLITQNSQLINQIGQFMQLVQAKPMGITSQQIYNVNKRQAAIQTNKYNRSLGLR